MKEVWRVRFQLQQNPDVRDLALFDLAIDSKLRGCDLVHLKVDDIAVGGRVKSRAVVRQRKTGHPVQFEITEQTREAVNAWCSRRTAGRGTTCSRTVATRRGR